MAVFVCFLCSVFSSSNHRIWRGKSWRWLKSFQFSLEAGMLCDWESGRVCLIKKSCFRQTQRYRLFIIRKNYPGSLTYTSFFFLVLEYILNIFPLQILWISRSFFMVFCNKCSRFSTPVREINVGLERLPSEPFWILHANAPPHPLSVFYSAYLVQIGL